MIRKTFAPAVLAALALLTNPVPALAEADMLDRSERGHDPGAAAAELPAYLECVPYAREVTGIRLYGDAFGWWDQAEGRYARGHAPKPGAVLALKPSSNMLLGHVAAVTRVVDSRTILLNHANWSPINGQRGQVEQDARAVDVSPGNDWSEVRIWYAPQGGLGTSRWPVQGFIYPDAAPRMAAAPRVPQTRIAQVEIPRDPIGAIIGTF
jgi:surface antigen